MNDLLLILPQLRALRSQLDALLFVAEMHAGIANLGGADPVETCPNCGASGETQQVKPSTMGEVGTTVFCRACKQTRVVGGPEITEGVETWRQ